MVLNIMPSHENTSRKEQRVTLEDGMQMIERALHEGRVTLQQAKMARAFLKAREEENVRMLRFEDFQVHKIDEKSDVSDLLARHQVLSAATQTAQALYTLLQGDTEIFERQKDTLQRRGGFFEPYDPAGMTQRAADENFLILQAGGRFFNMNTLLMDPYKNVADIQVQLSKDDPYAEPVAKIVKPQQDWPGCPWMQPESLRIYEEIAQNPATIACITDIGVERGYGRYRIVPTLQKMAIRHIHEIINPSRTHSIRYLIAQFFRIHGLKVPAEKKEISLESPIENKTSFSSHSFIHWESRTLANVPPQEMPVTFEHEGRSIDSLLAMGWSTLALDIEAIAKALSHTPNQIRLLYPWDGNHDVDFLKSFEQTSSK